jgi:hypothetical protein
MGSLTLPDTSRSNLAAALALVRRWRTKPVGFSECVGVVLVVLQHPVGVYWTDRVQPPPAPKRTHLHGVVPRVDGGDWQVTHPPHKSQKSCINLFLY